MKETGLKIRIFGDKALRKKCQKVHHVTAHHAEMLIRMSRIMYDASGVGLAAPQVGLDEAMIVVDAGSGLYKLINPVITKKESSQAMEEGCLSIPGICLKVKRAKRVIVQALDETGKAVEIEAEDLLACVLQHEIDHLRGKLIVDYASFIDKIKIKNKLQKLLKQSKEDELSKSEKKSCQLQL